MAKRVNVVGVRFGRLVVTQQRRMSKTERRTWCVCLCDCGLELITRLSSLRSGATQSCGCLRNELRIKRTRRHGCARTSERPPTSEYTAWLSARRRCFRPDRKSWKYYGGRGITMCDGWKDSFENFLADLGQKPSRIYSLDRRDVDGHYSCGKCEQCVANGWPANCRWATFREQAANRGKVEAVHESNSNSPA